MGDDGAETITSSHIGTDLLKKGAWSVTRGKRSLDSVW